MPAAAAGAVTGFQTLALAFASSTAAAVAYGAVYVVSALALNYGLNRLAQSLMGKPNTDTAGAPRDITVRGTIEPMQMIYGEVVTPGFVANLATSGANNNFLHFVIVLAAHECEDITDVWLDGERVPDADIDGDGDVSTSEFQGEGSSRLRIRRWLGERGQAADTDLSGAAIGNWSSDHRGAGVAYMHVRLDASDEAFPSGAPSNFRAKVRGRKLYDPAKDSTNGGSGTHRYNDATTWEWSQNAALAIRDYISGGSRWYDSASPEPRLGFGEANDHLDDAYTIAAASICNENVAIPPASPATTQRRYRADVQISCGDTYKENLEVLKSACAGNVTYVNGKYRIYAGAYDTPEIDLDEDDILGPVTVVTHPTGDELYNFVTGTFFDESRDWQQVPFPNITNSSYEADDGGQFRRPIELHATRTSYRAQRIAILHLAQSRNKIIVRFERLSPKAMAIAQHETFTVTISEYGWDQKVFRCLEWEFMPENGFIAITAREESSSRYADPSVGTYAIGEDGTIETPSYDEPTSPTSLTATGIIQGVLLEWQAPEPRNNDTVYHLYRHSAITPFGSATRIWSGNALRAVVEQDVGVNRYFWVTSELNGIESDGVPVGNGVLGTPSRAATDDLEDESATEIRIQTTAGPITDTDTSGTNTVDTLSFTAAFDGDLIVTIAFNAHQTAGAGIDSSGIRVWDTSVGGSLLGQSATGVLFDTTNRAHVLRSIVAITSGTDVVVELTCKHPGPGSSSTVFSNIEIETEFVKK